MDYRYYYETLASAPAGPVVRAKGRARTGPAVGILVGSAIAMQTLGTMDARTAALACAASALLALIGHGPVVRSFLDGRISRSRGDGDRTRPSYG